MAGIGLSKMGNNIDFSQLTEAILAGRSKPLTQLQNKSADFTKRSDMLKQLKSKLAALTSAADALTNRGLGTGHSAGSSSSGVATVSATDRAVNGTTNLNVTSLATRLSQTSRIYASAANEVLAGGAITATASSSARTRGSRATCWSRR